MTSPLVHAQHRAELSLVAGGLSGSYPTEILDPSDALPLTTLIVDLGPEGGDKGGRVVAEGTPEAVARVPDSYTGQYLAPYLGIKTEKQKKRA